MFPVNNKSTFGLPECTLMHRWCDCPSGVFGDTQTHTLTFSWSSRPLFSSPLDDDNLNKGHFFSTSDRKAWRRDRSKQLPVVSHKQGLIIQQGWTCTVYTHIVSLPLGALHKIIIFSSQILQLKACVCMCVRELIFVCEYMFTYSI